MSAPSTVVVSQGGGETRLAMLAPQGKYSKVPLRRSKKVLPEEEYIGGLEEVVESNYFPGLNALHDQYEYLQRKDARRVTERADGAGGSSNENNTAKPVTVSEYLSVFTSEDNADFDDLHQKDLELHRQKYHYLYEQQSGATEGMLSLYYLSKDTKLSHDQRVRLDKMLTNSDGSDFDSSNILTTRENDESNPLFESRQQLTDTWAFSVRNGLFFAPADINAAAKKRPLATQSVESIDGSEPTYPFIQRKNTRLHGASLLNRSSGLLPSPLEQPHTPSVYSDDSVSEHRYMLREEEGGGGKVYDYVSMTPTPLTSAAATPLDSLNYEMQPTSLRDRIARKLELEYSTKSEQQQTSSKPQHGSSKQQSTPLSLRRGTMTPASEAMYDKLVRQRRQGGGAAIPQEQGITKNLLKF